MKKISINKRLTLNKQEVVKLNQNELNNVKGGSIGTTITATTITTITVTGKLTVACHIN